MVKDNRVQVNIRMRSSLLAALKAKASTENMTYTEWLIKLVEQALYPTDNYLEELDNQLASRVDSLEKQLKKLASRIAKLEPQASHIAIQKLELKPDKGKPAHPSAFPLTANDACAIAKCNGSSLRQACRKAQARGESQISVKGVSFEFTKLGNQWWYRQC